MRGEEKNVLLKLYELSINEEQYYLNSFKNSISFFSGVITLLLGLILHCVISISDWLLLTFIIFAPVFLIVLCQIGIFACNRAYRRFLQTITVRAKIEQELGLTKPSWTKIKDKDDLYWKSESLIHPYHIESRIGTSESFVETNLTKGYNRWTKFLFHSFQFFSVLLILLIVSKIYLLI